MRYITAIAALFLLSGCLNQGNDVKYDGEALIEQKCAMCHNLKMPPDTYEDEKAPPMMAVVFHLKDFMKITMDDEKFSKFIPFVQDYVINPSRDKSYCDKESLESYGVMPSQKGNVTEDELEAIASYMYDFYDQQKYLKEMQEKAAFEALPKGEQLARKNGCLNCHLQDKPNVGPSFADIAKRGRQEIIDTIENGSKGKWKGFHAMMPAFKSKLSPKDIDTLQKWIGTCSGKQQGTKPDAHTDNRQNRWKVKNGI